jgi:hypothetical protein
MEFQCNVLEAVIVSIIRIDVNINPDDGGTYNLRNVGFELHT